MNMKFNHDDWKPLSGGMLLYRGFSQKAPEDTVLVRSPTDRKPAHMPLSVQHQMDDWFEKELGTRFRQRSLFTTGSLDVARRYAGDHGEVRVIQAIGPFQFCWSKKSHDLYDEFEAMSQQETIPAMLERLDFKCSDLEGALQSGNEIMLVGDAFKASRHL
ncbi:hypothetical protein hmeg3_13045 [Herbaspirillum sp. meg3]|uniref:hypothetical protein n=1 Tax=Herbaspirillum sp. meg3 TaxID=2025949 RepID=UPI000B9894B7|nr:hypothetical protein [Herbaspirillum sp. meg3]ASU39120.1 hypothetical protein hmeg3_13045 [Herbaspirillum sp. meg3]